MAKKCKCEACPECLPEWLAAFGDLMSLLLCFFVLLLSMSTMDAKKVQEAAGSLQGAMSVLDGENSTEVQHKQLQVTTSIQNEMGSIKQIKGIGLKTAQRLIVDLKDKIGLSDGNESNFLTSSNNRIKEESLSALIALGFTKKQVEKMIDKVLKDSPEMGVEEVIKIVLKGL